jgi:hypothetical protein
MVDEEVLVWVLVFRKIDAIRRAIRVTTIGKRFTVFLSKWARHT